MFPMLCHHLVLLRVRRHNLCHPTCFCVILWHEDHHPKAGDDHRSNYPVSMRMKSSAPSPLVARTRALDVHPRIPWEATILGQSRKAKTRLRWTHATQVSTML